MENDCCLGQIVFDNIPHKCDMVLRYYHRGFEKSLNTKGWAIEYMLFLPLVEQECCFGHIVFDNIPHMCDMGLMYLDSLSLVHLL